MIEKQWKFLQDLALLIGFATTLEGVHLTGGDLWQNNKWHRENSNWKYEDAGKVTFKERWLTPHGRSGQHPKRLAIDLNLFVDKEYISGYHDVWNELAGYWKTLGPNNRWGGDFSNVKDFNHFEAYYD